MTELLTFVHLTDLHVGNPNIVDERLYSETSKTLATILADVKRISPKPRFIVASGDLTNQGDEGSYEELTRLFDEADLDIPVLFALGNHDKREGFYRAMKGQTENLTAPYDHSTVIDGLHIIVLDTSAPFKVGGIFEAGQAEWLESELAQHADLPKLLVMHHAPALDDDASLEWESLSFADTETLRQLVAGHNVVGILSGHIHYDRVSNWHGIPVVVGVGQHAATDILAFPETFRMVSGASFAIGTLRPSGLTISFVPQPSERRELHSFSFAHMAEILKRYEDQAALAAAE
ncbi:metallophosphoesterase [Rhizobium sp. C4]|uniref:metallophosphoesterase n=1 Tax=Rhizobium sp. C4 TaxID=1349800 RepID=UPI001E4EC7D7|nr:metallophosphoesterase [Rhizobium sp. C4]MCD2172100.1 metallophosphoesterase [Rhizobium sp. C4]